MLAYVFFHRPVGGVEAEPYEARLAAFHRTLDLPSAAFRLAALPFGGGGPGYEDWYLVDGWAELGRLGDVALAAQRRGEHDAVAAQAGDGWGGVWSLVRGPAEVPPGVRWASKPRGEDYATFLRGLDAPAVWQRQLVLGPAPEFALAAAPDPGRERVA